METNFNYYVLQPIINSRTAFLTNDPTVNPDGADFLRLNKIVEKPSTVHLRLAFPVTDPDMTMDYFDLDTFAVFSQKVCDALIKNKVSVNDLQLINAVVSINAEEYNDFTIAYVHRKLKTFDEELSDVKRKSRDGRWISIKKIILDKNILSQIPLEDRLTYKSAEYSSLKLYHESIVDIIKSVNPTGVRFTPIEEWKQ